MKYRCDRCKAIWDGPGSGGTTCPQCKAPVHPLRGVKLRWTKRGNHIHVVVFMGDDLDHLANCGTLRMFPKEFDILRNSLEFAEETGISGQFENEEDENVFDEYFGKENRFELRIEEEKHGPNCQGIR